MKAASDVRSLTTLAQLAERYWRFVCHENPWVAINAGELTPDAVLFREASADHARRNDTAGALLAELGSIRLDSLAGQERATYQLLQREFEQIRSLYALRAYERVSLFPLGPEFYAVYFADTASITTVADAERYVDRLATIPAYLADVMTNLTNGSNSGLIYPRIVLESAAANARGIASAPIESQPWLGAFLRSPVATHAVVKGQAERARTVVAKEIVPAITAYADFLSQTLVPRARESIACTDSPDGREFYLALVRQFTSSTLTPEKIHELGLAEVARLNKSMELVAKEAGFPGNLFAFREHLRTDPTLIASSKDGLREQIEVLSKRIERRLPAFFGHLPRMTYGVESIPEAIAARMPPAYAQPNPADRSGPGIHWITSVPAKCPSFMHIPLALHEAWPGHLMHLALLQEKESLPAFRRHGALNYSMCLEGWAVYCESLGVEMGLYQTPAQQYGRLDMEIWRALRLVVDTGIHWLGWSRTQAIDLMMRYQALPRVTIEAEVDRYIALPGQALAYQLGLLKIRELREKAETTLGDRFDIRGFHDALMDAGAVTHPVLDVLIIEWIESAHLAREVA
jgi:uncharacterized protein (DUF885 family)